MTTYTSAEVAELAGTPYRTLMRWAAQGLLNPEGAHPGRGVGRWQPTTWRDKDVREASILTGLRRAGFSLQRLREGIEYLRSIGHNPMSTGAFLAVRDGDGPPSELIKLCDSGEAIALLQQPGQMVFRLWVPDQTIE